MTTEFQTGADHMTAPTAPVRLICIGTHHKTGTLWMRWVFRVIAQDYAETLGADLVALGYETHPNDWVQETRP